MMEIVSMRRTNEKVKKMKRAIRRAKNSLDSIFLDSVQHIDDFAHKLDCRLASFRTALGPLQSEIISMSDMQNVYHLALAAFASHLNEKGFLEVNFDNGRKRIKGALSVPLLHRVCTDILLPKQFMFYFEALIGGSLAEYYINEYLKYSKHLYTTLIRAFKNYHIPKTKILEYLSMIHRLKPPMLVDDLQVAFVEYGYTSKEFESFLEANPTFDLRNPPPYPLPEEVQRKFWKYLPTVWIAYLEYGFPINTDEDVLFRNDFLRKLLPCLYPTLYNPAEVPTLKQKSIDVLREYIHRRCVYNKPLSFYKNISRLKIPIDIKEILLLRKVTKSFSYE